MAMLSWPVSLAACGRPARTVSTSGRAKKSSPGASRRSGVRWIKPASARRSISAETDDLERKPTSSPMRA
jgi:hypothetical protein